MLTWVGSCPARVRAYPAQAIERFDATARRGLAGSKLERWPNDLPKGGLLYHGDNKDVLAHLLANGFRGKVKLIYIDRRSTVGRTTCMVQLRGIRHSQDRRRGHTLGEQVQYSDIWAGDNYLQVHVRATVDVAGTTMAESTRSIGLHYDSSKSHLLRLLLDLFGQDHRLRKIIWAYRRWPSVSQISTDARTHLVGTQSNDNSHTFINSEEASESC